MQDPVKERFKVQDNAQEALHTVYLNCFPTEAEAEAMRLSMPEDCRPLILGLAPFTKQTKMVFASIPQANEALRRGAIQYKGMSYDLRPAVRTYTYSFLMPVIWPGLEGLEKAIKKEIPTVTIFSKRWEVLGGETYSGFIRVVMNKPAPRCVFIEGMQAFPRRIQEAVELIPEGIQYSRETPPSTSSTTSSPPPMRDVEAATVLEKEAPRSQEISEHGKTSQEFPHHGQQLREHLDMLGKPCFLQGATHQGT